MENWTKPIFNILVASDFRHRVSTISLARCRHVYPRRNIIQIFFPIAGRQIFPRENAISLSNDRAPAARSRIICPREWTKIAKNRRKRTCRRGSARWTPREKGGMSGRNSSIYGIFQGIPKLYRPYNALTPSSFYRASIQIVDQVIESRNDRMDIIQSLIFLVSWIKLTEKCARWKIFNVYASQFELLRRCSLKKKLEISRCTITRIHIVRHAASCAERL